MKLALSRLRQLPGVARSLLAMALLGVLWMIVVLVTGGVDTSIAGVRVRANDWFDPLVIAGVSLLMLGIWSRRHRPAPAPTTASFHWWSTDGVLLVAILGVALIVRVWGLSFGLPHPDARPDEGAVGAIAGGFLAGHFEPPGFDWPPLFILIIAGAIWLIFAKTATTLARFGIHREVPGLTMPAERLIARALSALAGVASVWLLFRAALRLFGRPVAFLAAGFLAVAFLHVRDSHFGVTDIPMTFMVLAGFLAIVRFAESGTTSDLALGAICTGLGAATKYNAALLVVPASFAILSETSSRSFGTRVGRIVLFAGVAAVAFVIVCPYAVLTPDKFLTDFLKQSRHLAEGHGTELGRGWIYHLSTTLRYGLGIPLFAAGVLGLPLMVWREGRRGILTALFPVAYYLFIGSGRTVFARYILPAVPFLCLSASYAVLTAATWLTQSFRRPRWQRAVAAALAIVVIVPSAVSVVTFDRLLAREDSRVTARRWVEQRFPPGTTIAQWGQPNAHIYADFEVTYRLSPIVRSERPALIAIVSSPMNPLPNLREFLPFLSEDYVLAFEDVVVPEDNPANVYDLQDEFFLPLTGFLGITRPGPNVRIFVRRREPVLEIAGR